MCKSSEIVLRNTRKCFAMAIKQFLCSFMKPVLTAKRLLADKSDKRVEEPRPDNVTHSNNFNIERALSYWITILSTCKLCISFRIFTTPYFRPAESCRYGNVILKFKWNYTRQDMFILIWKFSYLLTRASVLLVTFPLAHTQKLYLIKPVGMQTIWIIITIKLSQ